MIVDREAVRRRQLEQRPFDRHRIEMLRQELLRYPGPIEWTTVEEAARLCRRAPGTIRNLISKFDLPRRKLWLTFNRQRRRHIMLHPGVVRWLQEATLSAPTRAERRAGVVPRVVERGRALEAKEVGR